MEIRKFLTQDKLLEYLNIEIEDLLVRNQVWSFDSFGFLDADTEDPNYFGMASWQLRRLYEVFDTTYSPTEKEKKIIVGGTDFEGLMKMARTTIGYLLLHKSYSVSKLYSDDNNYWLFYSNSVVNLNMASDRIRDFLISTFDYHSICKQKYCGRKKVPFDEPFNNAKKCFIGKNYELNDILNQFASISRLAGEVRGYRKKRNEIVHEIASRLAMSHKKLFDMERVSTNENAQKPSFNDQIKHFEVDKYHKINELDEGFKFCAKWYSDLIDLANAVFWVEYKLRDKR